MELVNVSTKTMPSPACYVKGDLGHSSVRLAKKYITDAPKMSN